MSHSLAFTNARRLPLCCVLIQYMWRARNTYGSQFTRFRPHSDPTAWEKTAVGLYARDTEKRTRESLPDGPGESAPEKFGMLLFGNFAGKLRVHSSPFHFPSLLSPMQPPPDKEGGGGKRGDDYRTLAMKRRRRRRREDPLKAIIRYRPGSLLPLWEMVGGKLF